MAFKIDTVKYDSKTCPDVIFRLFRKSYGRRIELELKMSGFNQSLRDLGERRQLIIEEAKAKATETLYGKAKSPTESLIQIGQVQTESGTSQVADQLDPTANPRFQVELIKNVNLRELTELDEKANQHRLANLKPIYFETYLSEVKGLELEDDSPLNFSTKMTASERETFFRTAPAELIDEIFNEIAVNINMSDEDRANFGLPIIGSPPAVGKMEEATTALSAVPANTIETATAVSQK